MKCCNNALVSCQGVLLGRVALAVVIVRATENHCLEDEWQAVSDFAVNSALDR